MKRIACLLCMLVLLTGCAGSEDHLDRAMALRGKLLASAVSFDARVTADYSEYLYSFTLHCVMDAQGELRFQVTAPESISGISGTVSKTGGKLTFDDKALGFSLMAEGRFSPVSGPWILMNTLRSGYLTSCTMEGGQLRISIDDSFESDALHLDIWLSNEDAPVRGEVLWKGRRILTVEIENFRFA